MLGQVRLYHHLVSAGISNSIPGGSTHINSHRNIMITEVYHLVPAGIFGFIAHGSSHGNSHCHNVITAMSNESMSAGVLDLSTDGDISVVVIVDTCQEL